MILLKSIIYRIFASGITSLIAFAMTGSLTISLGIGIFEFCSKIFAYYVFEKLWNKALKLMEIKSYRQECFKFNKNGSVILISGLNCSGKTTIAKELIRHIPNAILLDGDAIRNSINYDVGFSDNDIHTNLTKVANLANLLNDQGYNVVISCISRKKNDRLFMRQIFKSKNVYEIYVKCNEKDLKKRQSILHPNTKVIQTDYERSDYDVIEVNTSVYSPSKCVEKILCSI